MGAWIVIAEGPGEGDGVEVTTGPVVIGRDDGVDLQLSEAGVSRRHAEVRPGGAGSLSIADLGSANGTYVNSEPVESERELFDGDLIVVGGVTLELRGGPEAPTEAIAPGAVETERVEPPRELREARAEERPRREPRPEQPPRRDAPPPAAGAGVNYAAIGAIVLGPLSILLVVLGSGFAFYASLPLAVAGVALGSTGKRRADSGDSSGLRGVALAGQIFSVVGVVLAALVIALLLIFNQIVDASADSLSGLIDEIRFEVEDVPLPEELLE